MHRSLRSELQGLWKRLHSGECLLHDDGVPRQLDLLGERMPVQPGLQTLRWGLHSGEFVLQGQRMSGERDVQLGEVYVQCHVQGLQRGLHSRGWVLYEWRLFEWVRVLGEHVPVPAAEHRVSGQVLERGERYEQLWRVRSRVPAGVRAESVQVRCTWYQRPSQRGLRHRGNLLAVQQQQWRKQLCLDEQ